MTTQKISVTLEAEAVAQARMAAGPRGLSSYLDLALSEKLERDRGREALLSYLDELELAEPTSDAVRRRAERRVARLRNAIGG